MAALEDAKASGGVRMDWRRAVLAWLLIALAETLHGAVRAMWLVPLVGDLASRQIGVLTGSVIVLIIAWATFDWMGARNRADQWGVGLLWLALMLAFEIGLGLAVGAGWERLLADYLPWKGGFMLAGMAVLALAPWIAARLRSGRRPESP
jgi:hypothetical protein